MAPGAHRCEAPGCTHEACFKCGDCLAAQYCSERCHTLAWDVSGDHALECADLGARVRAGGPGFQRLGAEVPERAFTYPPTDGSFNVQLFDLATQEGLLPGLGVQVPVSAPVRYRLGVRDEGYMYEAYGDGALSATLPYVEDEDAEALLGARVFRGLLSTSLSAFAHLPRRRRAGLDVGRVNEEVAAAKRELERVKMLPAEGGCIKKKIFEDIDNAKKNVRQFELRRNDYDDMKPQPSVDGALTLRLGALPPLGALAHYEMRQGGRRVHIALRERRGGAAVEIVRLRFFLPLKQSGA